MDLQVAGQTALVTGAGEGMGALAARMLAAEGARVAVADLDGARAEAVAADIREAGGEARAFALDVRDGEAARGVVEAARAALGPVEMLLHTPGRGERKPLVDSTPEDWEFSIGLNLVAPLHVTRAVLDDMIARRRGSLTYVVSDAGRVGEPRNPVYSAAKGGVIALAKALARELGPHGIRANCVALSAMRTPAGLRHLEEIARRTGRRPEEIEKKVLAGYCLRRLGEPQDAANALCFLASPLASWITGQTLSVNGGYAMV